MGATSGRPRDRRRARRLGHRLDGARPRGGASQDLEYDLLLAGADTSDGGAGVVPAGVATLLGLPYLSYAAKIEPDPAAGRVRVHRISPTGLRRPRGADAGPRRRRPRRSASRATRRSRGSWPRGRRTIETSIAGATSALDGTTVGGAVATTRRRRLGGAAAARRDASRPRPGRRGRPRGRRLPRRAEAHLMAGAIWVIGETAPDGEPGADQHGGRDARPDARRASGGLDAVGIVVAAGARPGGRGARQLRPARRSRSPSPRPRDHASATIVGQRLGRPDRARSAVVAVRRRRTRRAATSPGSLSALHGLGRPRQRDGRRLDDGGPVVAMSVFGGKLITTSRLHRRVAGSSPSARTS